MTVAITIISSSLHWLWLFWEILRDSYLARYISVTINTNNEWSLHSFFFWKISIINWLLYLLILIHLFQPPHANKCEWTEWNNLLCYQPMILLLDISKNKSVLATFCIHACALQSYATTVQRLPILFIQPFHPLLLPPSPNPIES